MEERREEGEGRAKGDVRSLPYKKCRLLGYITYTIRGLMLLEV